MDLTGLDLYGLNSLRRYPIDDAASAVADDGTPLPPGLLVDLAVRFPSSLGTALALAAATATPGLVTLVFVAYPAPALGPSGPAASATPLPACSVAIPQPVVPGLPYPVQPLAPGVGGWAVFGPGALGDSPYSGRFSAVAQGAILGRCARPYGPPAIPTVRRQGVADVLTGLVTLAAGADLAVAVASLPIDRANTGSAVTTPAIVVALADSIGGRDVFGLYSGPCAARPESGTCPRPPLTQFGPAVPDCAGNINLRIKGAVLTPTAHGVVVDVAAGLGAACGTPALPDSTGALAGAATDLCVGTAAATPDVPGLPTTAVTAPGATVPPTPAAGACLWVDDFSLLPASKQGTWTTLHDSTAGLAGTWSAGVDLVPPTTQTPGGVGGTHRLVKLGDGSAGTLAIARFAPDAHCTPGTGPPAATALLRLDKAFGKAFGGLALQATGAPYVLAGVSAGQLVAFHYPGSIISGVALPTGWDPGGWFTLAATRTISGGSAGAVAITATAVAGGASVTLNLPAGTVAASASWGLAAQETLVSFAYYDFSVPAS